MPDDTLILEVAQFTDAWHWRWVLKDAGGAFLADHSVALDPAREPLCEALVNLPGYLWHHAAPDRRDADERRLIAEIGAGIGARVFGNIAQAIAGQRRPVVVRVILPPAAEGLSFLPLELGHAGGKPLALRDVSLVFQIAGEPPGIAAASQDSLRILALFSLPPEQNPLNLRRERRMLKDLVHELAGTRGLAIDLRVLQYGVTREILQDTLEDGQGWDVIHFSGHGEAGSLLLENLDGSSDAVSAEDLAEMLQLAQGRLKLVVASACLSAARTIEETRRWLGLDDKPRREQAARAEPTEPEPAPNTVARSLVASLDCAVLGMRYSVEDEFAVQLARELYRRLFDKGQALPRATQLSLRACISDGASADTGALSVATPALFGAKAADLHLIPPAAAATGFAVPKTGLFGFEEKEPERFVGRVAAMTAASAALAEKSGKAGVLFHGMAGGGKTACALELAYQHGDTRRFRAFAWYSAPKTADDIALALRDFALALERQIPDLAMVHVVDRIDELRAWLPRFKAVLKATAILVVLDNVETLLTADGQWRDERWELVAEALLTHGGLSRTVLTCRVAAAGLPAAVAVIPVHALPLAEALLLMRDLPHLGALLRGQAAAIGAAEGRDLARRTLRVVQGHPKLIGLAEGQAADPAALGRQVERAEAAALDGGGRLDAFFREGVSALGAEDFLRDLAEWTRGVVATLPEPAQILFRVLCALEDGDRESWIIAPVWPHLRKALGRPKVVLEEALAPLVAAGLVELRPLNEQIFALALHPGITEAGRPDDAFRAAVDGELGQFWREMLQFGLAQEGEQQGAGPLILRAGLAAAPYLMRRDRWDSASWALEQMIARDESPATIAAALPLLRRIAAATAGTEREAGYRGVLARALASAGRIDEAETELRTAIAHADTAGNHRLASANSGDLVNLLREAGRNEPALAEIERKVEFTRRAGLGPWTQLADEGQRLQILNALGRHDEVLRRVEQLRATMAGLPDPPGPNEAVTPWNVRETLLTTGCQAAQNLKNWQAALDLNADSLLSKEKRGASALERARFRFNDYGPLLRLGRFDEARDLLTGCRAAFEQAGAVSELGKVLSALADLEGQTTGPAAARRFEAAALRHKYLAHDPGDMAISHFNLANYIVEDHGPPGEALAHRLAAVLLVALMRSGRLQSGLQALADDLGRLGPAGRVHLPQDFDALCATVEQVEGVHFREAFDRLAAPQNITGDELLQQIVADVLTFLDQAAAAPQPSPLAGEGGPAGAG